MSNESKLNKCNERKYEPLLQEVFCPHLYHKNGGTTFIRESIILYIHPHELIRSIGTVLFQHDATPCKIVCFEGFQPFEHLLSYRNE